MKKKIIFLCMLLGLGAGSNFIEKLEEPHYTDYNETIFNETSSNSVGGLTQGKKDIPRFADGDSIKCKNCNKWNYVDYFAPYDIECIFCGKPVRYKVNTYVNRTCVNCNRVNYVEENTPDSTKCKYCPDPIGIKMEDRICGNPNCGLTNRVSENTPRNALCKWCGQTMDKTQYERECINCHTINPAGRSWCYNCYKWIDKLVYACYHCGNNNVIEDYSSYENCIFCNQPIYSHEICLRCGSNDMIFGGTDYKPNCNRCGLIRLNPEIYCVNCNMPNLNNGTITNETECDYCQDPIGIKMEDRVCGNPNCGATNRVRADAAEGILCNVCGQTMDRSQYDRACLNCGAMNSSGNIICGDCGKHVDYLEYCCDNCWQYTIIRNESDWENCMHCHERIYDFETCKNCNKKDKVFGGADYICVCSRCGLDRKVPYKACETCGRINQNKGPETICGYQNCRHKMNYRYVNCSNCGQENEIKKISANNWDYSKACSSCGAQPLFQAENNTTIRKAFYVTKGNAYDELKGCKVKLIGSHGETIGTTYVGNTGVAEFVFPNNELYSGGFCWDFFHIYADDGVVSVREKGSDSCYVETGHTLDTFNVDVGTLNCEEPALFYADQKNDTYQIFTLLKYLQKGMDFVGSVLEENSVNIPKVICNYGNYQNNKVKVSRNILGKWTINIEYKKDDTGLVSADLVLQLLGAGIQMMLTGVNSELIIGSEENIYQGKASAEEAWLEGWSAAFAKVTQYWYVGLNIFSGEEESCFRGINLEYFDRIGQINFDLDPRRPYLVAMILWDICDSNNCTLQNMICNYDLDRISAGSINWLRYTMASNIKTLEDFYNSISSTYLGERAINALNNQYGIYY